MPEDQNTPVPSYWLLLVGVFLLILPLGFFLVGPDRATDAERYLRVVSALGGGLIGAFIPGFLRIELPYAKAGGALAIFLVIYGVNPPGITQKLFSDLETVSSDWVAAAKEARSSGAISPRRPLPVGLSQSRSNFETAWENARTTEKTALPPQLVSEALSLTLRLYRIQEIESETKPTAFKWADIAIAYFEQINHREFLVEALLDKAALYLELSQIEHTDPDSWRAIAQAGDKVIARAFSLAEAKQKPDTLRLWSRFFYNIARPKSGNLTKDWDNTYLLASLEKMEEAYSLDPERMSNATQLARTMQKAAANPPQATDPLWTKKLRATQEKLLRTWENNEAALTSPTQRIPPLNIIAVLTLNVVTREWLETPSGQSEERGTGLIREMNDVAIRAQREAITLLPSTEWEEDYDFDMYYDLARMQGVACRITSDAGLQRPEAFCNEAFKNFAIAKKRATSIQLNASRQAMISDPIAAAIPEPAKTKIANLLDDPSTD
ncbi:MAG: hypothetical protein JJ959_03050 [Nisaea sp.]|uniref:hypothetical protein n=1 Tax=Nisaea sp. TaxID=2024842 RepID=UPI001B2227BC|nr:hypothetical protein [Nisaea sp.]MBO6559482.1 hypothetical protein [Nisaea sp.]